MLVQADAASLQPQIDRDENGFLSCGLRSVVITGTSEWMEVNDFSVTVHGERIGGVIKAGKRRARTAKVLSGNLTLPHEIVPM